MTDAERLEALLSERMDYADPSLDGPAPDSRGPCYMVCGTRRSGTTLTANLLWETGCLGKPFEYRLPTMRAQMDARMPPGPSYWERLRAVRSTPNGVFAFKEVSPLLYLGGDPAARAAEGPGGPGGAGAPSGGSPGGDPGRIVPDKAVWVERRNEVAQAISYAVALKTGSFLPFQPERAEPEYDFRAIFNAMAVLARAKTQWMEALAKDGLVPHKVVYEEIGPETIEGIAGFLGVALDRRPTAPPPAALKRAGRRSLEWEERFRREVEAHGGGFGGGA